MMSIEAAISRTWIGRAVWGRDSLTARVSWLTCAKTAGFVFSIALPLLLVRRMDREHYGLYKQAFLVITTAMIVLPLGVPMSAFYFLPRETTRRCETVLNIVLFHVAAGALACGALALCPSILTAIFHHSGLAPYAAWIGVVILFWVIGSFLDIVPVANDEIRLASAFIVAIQASRALVFVGAILAFGTLRSLLVAAILHGAIQTIVLFCYLESRFAGFWRAFDWQMLREQLSYAIPLGAAGILMIVQTDLHNYFVSNHFGPAMFAVYSLGTLQLPLMGLIQEATNSVLITRVSILEKRDERREILMLAARAARQLAVVYFPVYVFLMVAGREFIRVLFTARFADSWPIFAVNLTLLPLGILLLDPLYRAFEHERYFLLRLRLLLAAALILTLALFTARLGLLGVIAVVVLIAVFERIVMAIHFGRLLGVTRRDAVLLRDVGKLALAALAAGVVADVIRLLLARESAFAILAICGVAFALVYLPLASIATSGEVSSR
ncbi:MAG TPA: oligosaccharide flippase family protein [Bryobacteraceae bacterium]|nr:oligosaccharide flippase family protein [Bryobacteraceae bacterium]